MTSEHAPVDRTRRLFVIEEATAILARTPAPLWDMRRNPPALLSAGDKVVFQPVSLREYEALLARAAAGDLRLAAHPPDREPDA